MSRALKLAKRELTRLGCAVVSRGPHTLKFQLSRSEWVCYSHTPLAVVRSVIAQERTQIRVGSGNYLEAFPAAESWETLTEHNIYTTEHGKETIKLMCGQALAMREIYAALFAPEIVRVNTRNGNRIYCAGRIGVVVGDRERGQHGIVTVLWATDDLWEQYPRPDGSRDG